MLNFLLNVLQIAVAIKVIHYGLKRILFRKKFKSKTSRKSVACKIGMLISNRIHHYLNCKLTAQKEALQLSRNKSKTPNPKVIPIRRKTTN